MSDKDELAQRRDSKTDYQPRHGAGLETTEQMEEAAAKQRHPSSYKPKHGKDFKP
jgi:hypothetical protein